MDKNKKTTLFQIVKYLKKQRADVICLQEVLHSQYEFMKLYLRMNGIFAENVESQKYGICIFSKYKIIEKYFSLGTLVSKRLLTILIANTSSKYIAHSKALTK